MNKTHIVKTGETLQSLARFYYGDENKYTLILNVNPAIINNQIFKDDVLTIPELPELSGINTLPFLNLNNEEEVSLFARNCDIAEETTRLSGHVSTYKSAMKNVKSDVGKKLDFIAQEMQREANTIGSKSSDFKISKAVIDVKSQIEKIREQVRNIE